MLPWRRRGSAATALSETVASSWQIPNRLSFCNTRNVSRRVRCCLISHSPFFFRFLVVFPLRLSLCLLSLLFLLFICCRVCVLFLCLPRASFAPLESSRVDFLFALSKRFCWPPWCTAAALHCLVFAAVSLVDYYMKTRMLLAAYITDEHYLHIQYV